MQFRCRDGCWRRLGGIRKYADNVAWRRAASYRRPLAMINQIKARQQASSPSESMMKTMPAEPRRLAWLGNSGNIGSRASWADAQAAAASIGREVKSAEIATTR